MHVLLRPRWVVLFILTGLLITLFVNLGFWQQGRLAERRASNAEIEERMGDEAIGVDAALAAVSQSLDVAALEYSNVTATGRFDAERLLMVRNETYRGQAGFHVIVPLVVGGQALLVNIGWVPLGTEPTQAMSLVPPETLEVRGLLRPTQIRPRIGREEPEGILTVVNRIDIDRFQSQFEEDLMPFWVQLEEPDDPLALPVPLAPPSLDEGAHFSYMIQWFSFALIALAGVVALARRDVLKGTGLVRDQEPAER